MLFGTSFTRSHALTCEALLHRLKATAAKRDVIDDAVIRPPPPVRPGNIIEVQHGMTRTYNQAPGKLNCGRGPFTNPSTSS